MQLVVETVDLIQFNHKRVHLNRCISIQSHKSRKRMHTMQLILHIGITISDKQLKDYCLHRSPMRSKDHTLIKRSSTNIFNSITSINQWLSCNKLRLQRLEKGYQMLKISHGFTINENGLRLDLKFVYYKKMEIIQHAQWICDSWL